MNQTIWSAPAEVTPAPMTSDTPGAHMLPACNCFWHRRIFSHIGIGPVGTRDRQRLPLGREITRDDYDDGRIEWLMRVKIEGAQLLVSRFCNPGPPEFQAWIAGPATAHWLEPHNDHSKRPRGGDPTLIWDLPERVGRVRFPAGSQLIVWQEAWWWRPVLADGCLVDPLSAPADLSAGQGV